MLRSLVAGGVILSAVSVQAAVVPTITFASDTDYKNNFNTTSASASRFSYDSTGKQVKYVTTTNNTGTQTLQYTPSADFLTETLSYDTSFSGFNSAPSSGILTRIQTTGAAAGTGILALINSTNTNATSTTSLQLRLYSNVNGATGTVGTSFFDKTFTTTDANNPLARAIATGQLLHVTLTQTSADDPVFNLTVSDSTGNLATTGDVPFKTNDNYNTAGGIALRGSASYVGITTTFDNLAATPEPGSLALLGLGGIAMLRRRRQRG